jgi:hypothetical protein
MMPVRRARFEAGSIARLDQHFSLVLYQHQLAFKSVDQPIHPLVPMPQRRGRAGLERGD